jgi:hypothetical protein
MALSEQINLMGFQKALEDKAGDMMAALINNLSGKEAPKKTYNKNISDMAAGTHDFEKSSSKKQIKASNMNSTSR